MKEKVGRTCVRTRSVGRSIRTGICITPCVPSNSREGGRDGSDAGYI